MSIRTWKLLEGSTQSSPKPQGWFGDKFWQWHKPTASPGNCWGKGALQSLSCLVLFTPEDSIPQLHTSQSSAALLSPSSPRLRAMAQLSHPVFPTATPAAPKSSCPGEIRGS